MSVAAAVPVFFLCVAASLGASLLFGRRLDRVSERFGANEGLHGILTALGADAPEISTAIVALSSSHGKLGVGVVVGSNVFNLAALLGLPAIVAGTVAIHRHGLVFNGAVALVVTGIGAALVLGAIGAVPALILLLVVFGPYVVVLSLSIGHLRRLLPDGRVERLVVAAVREEIVDMRTGEVAPRASRRDFLALIASLAVIVGASFGMVEAATDLGSRWGVSDVIVGTLVLASLTSLPNLITAVRLALHGRGAATTSEALNSNSLNIIAGVAIPALFISLGSRTGIETFCVWWLLGTTVVAAALAYTRHGLTRREGIAIVALYAVFVGVVSTR